MSKNLYYTVREIYVEDGKTHSCTGRIVAVIGAARNQGSGRWYLTVLVERDEP